MHLSTPLYTWSKALDEEKSVRVLFVDYRKAFDHVDHATVLRKMKSMGVPDFIVQWCHSFLSARRQRVKINNFLSDWLKLNGGMPQGTWLGLYVFLILINDLEAAIPLLKYVDDVTASEILGKQETSTMQSVVDTLANWSRMNFMNLNIAKTKEMLIGAINKNPPGLLSINNQEIDRVTSFKLLGVIVTNTLDWNENITKICSKASTRLHFLKMLKRAGMSQNELVCYYRTVVRPVMEYSCSLWQSNITEEQTHRLDSIQRRAEHIIGISDCNIKTVANGLTPLKERREFHARRLFNSVLQPANCLHNILPSERNESITNKLRRANKLPVPFARTERYKCSFLLNALANYQ
jgi:Reverse transcriptase (RNA-dependent DNA polymerase)/Domain of unknown function (DUF1891)